jgi:ribose 5-phosphate isomerase B
VVAVGARMHTTDEAIAIVETFLTTAWSREDRHQRRIDLLLAYEATGEHA